MWYGGGARGSCGARLRLAARGSRLGPQGVQDAKEGMQDAKVVVKMPIWGAVPCGAVRCKMTSISKWPRCPESLRMDTCGSSLPRHVTPRVHGLPVCRCLGVERIFSSSHGPSKNVHDEHCRTVQVATRPRLLGLVEQVCQRRLPCGRRRGMPRTGAWCDCTPLPSCFG